MSNLLWVVSDLVNYRQIVYKDHPALAEKSILHHISEIVPSWWGLIE